MVMRAFRTPGKLDTVRVIRRSENAYERPQDLAGTAACAAFFRGHADEIRSLQYFRFMFRGFVHGKPGFGIHLRDGKVERVEAVRDWDHPP